MREGRKENEIQKRRKWGKGEGWRMMPNDVLGCVVCHHVKCPPHTHMKWKGKPTLLWHSDVEGGEANDDRLHASEAEGGVVMPSQWLKVSYAPMCELMAVTVLTF